MAKDWTIYQDNKWDKYKATDVKKKDVGEGTVLRSEDSPSIEKASPTAIPDPKLPFDASTIDPSTQRKLSEWSLQSFKEKTGVDVSMDEIEKQKLANQQKFDEIGNVPTDSGEFITRSAYSNSLLSKATRYASKLSELGIGPAQGFRGLNLPLAKAIKTELAGELRQEHAELAEYDGSIVENAVAGAASIMLDIPLFMTGGSIGAVGTKGIISYVKPVFKGLQTQFGKKTGITIGKIAMKQAAIERTAIALGAGGNAFGGYDALNHVAEELEGGKDLKEIELSGIAKEYAKGFGTGAAFSGLAGTFGKLRRIADAKVTSDVAKKWVQAGITTAELPAEAGLFTIANAVMRDVPMSADEFVNNLAFVGVLKATGALKANPERPKIPSIEFSPEEKALVGVSKVEELIGKEADIPTIMNNPKVPFSAKAKIAFEIEGAPIDKVDWTIDKVAVQQNTLKSYNKDGTLLDVKTFETPEEARSEQRKAQNDIEDVKLLDKAGELSIEEQAKIERDVVGSGVKPEEFNDAITTPFDARSQEQHKAIKKFSDAIETHEKEKLKTSVTKPTKTPLKKESNTKVPLEDTEANLPIYKGKKFYSALYDPKTKTIEGTVNEPAAGTGSHKAYGPELSKRYEDGELFMVIPVGDNLIAVDRAGIRLEDKFGKGSKDWMESMIELPKREEPINRQETEKSAELPTEEPKAPQIESLNATKGNDQKVKQPTKFTDKGNEISLEVTPKEDMGTYVRKPSGTKGVALITGLNLRTDGESIRDIRFDKKLFSEEKAQQWYEKNKNKLSLQNELDKQNQGGDNILDTGGAELRGAYPSEASAKQSRYDAGRGGRPVGDVALTLSDKEALDITSANPKVVVDKSFSETKDASLFHKSISASKQGNKYAASVFVYPEKDYKKYRKFITDDGLAGASVTPDGTIISVFSHGKGKGRAAQIVLKAIQEGGRKLDHYDTALTDYYYDFGFKPVAKVKWNDKYAPKDWNKDTFKRFNNGEPDVVLMVYDGGNPKTLSERYKKFGLPDEALASAPYVKTYEEGQKLQDEYLKKSGERQEQSPQLEKQEGPYAETPSIQQGSVSFFGLDKLFDSRLSAGQIYNKYMKSGGNLPKDVFESHLKAINTARGHVAKAESLRKDFEKVARQVYGKKLVGNKMSKEQAEELNDVLTTMGTDPTQRAQALSVLDKRLWEPLTAIRNHVDWMSGEMARLGVINDKLSATITSSLGVYLTRSYRAHKDKGWIFENIPPEIRNKAYKAIENPNPKMTHEEIEGLLKAMLDKNSGVWGDVKTGGGLGRRDLSITMQRKDLEKSIRDFLGEYKDPMYNYMESVAKMAQFIENSKFLENVKETGKDVFLFSKPTGEFNVPIVQPGDYGYYPLSYKMKFEGKEGMVDSRKAYYTSREIADAFKSNSTSAYPDWYKFFMKANAYMKMGKTVYSPTAHARNFVGNILIQMANGRLSPTAFGEMSKVISGYVTDNPKMREEVQRLISDGVIGKNVQANEILDGLKAGALDMRSFDKFQESTLKKLGKKANRGILSAYQLEDEIYKVYSYYFEKNAYTNVFKKRNPNATPEEIEQMAHDKAVHITKMTNPDYDYVPRLVKDISRFPMTGTFVMFPAEMIRTTKNTINLAFEELKEPETRVMGARRLVGTTAALSFSAAVAGSFNSLRRGLSDDETDAMKLFSKPYNRYSDWVVYGNPEPGVYRFIDMGFSDPYSSLKKFVNVIDVEGISDEKALKILYEQFEPYVGADIMAQKITEVVMNKNLQTGDEIYRNTDSESERFKKMAEYVWKGVEPGFLTTYGRMRRAAKGESKATVQDELMAMFSGQRRQTLDVGKEFRNILYDKGNDLSNLVRDYRSVVRRDISTPEDIQSAYATISEKTTAIVKELNDLYTKSIQLGVPPDKANDLVKEMSLGAYKANQALKDAILYGGDIFIDETTGGVR